MTASQRLNPMALNGMITTPHYLASQAGIAMLRRGGTAVDAAIAAGAALSVVYPQMCGLGGDGFWLIYTASAGKLTGINASGRSGLKVTRECYGSRKAIPFRGPLAAITVPGVVSGWALAHAHSCQSMGSRISWSELLEEAIELASGFPVCPGLAGWIKADSDPKILGGVAEFVRTFMPGGVMPLPGDILALPELRATLARLAENGPEEFYQGETAERLVKGLSAMGGLLTLRDFREHEAFRVEPISVNFRECQAYNLPPNTQGISSLQILAMLNTKNKDELRPESADWLHFLVEATRMAFADRERYVTDPDFMEIALDRLLSPELAASRARSVDMRHAGSNSQTLVPAGDTIWLGCVDRDGNAVSYIQSLYGDFGSGVMPGGTGVLLQNRGSFFSLDLKHANALEPGKRSMHTLNPPMLLKDGRPYLVYGTMGGEGQPQTQAAVVSRILDKGLTPQEAIDAPRWLYGRAWGAPTNSLRLEGRFSEELANDLSSRGHAVEMIEDYSDLMGHAGAIIIQRKKGSETPDGQERCVLHGATDPRSDGLACGY